MAFAEGQIYKITSVADGSQLHHFTSVLDLTGSGITTNGVGNNYSPSHLTAETETTRNGSGWEISSLVQASEKKCLDQDVGSATATLLNYVSHKGSNQQWNAKEVSPGANVFTITNVYNCKCMANTGRGKVVKLESPVQSKSSGPDPRGWHPGSCHP